MKINSIMFKQIFILQKKKNPRFSLYQKSNTSRGNEKNLLALPVCFSLEYSFTLHMFYIFVLCSNLKYEKKDVDFNIW